MFAQRPPDRRRFLGMAALTLAAAWIGTREPVLRLIRDAPFRAPGASDLASLGRATAWLNSAPLTAADLQGQGRPRRLLDLHLHQLAAHAAIRSRLGRTYKDQGLVVIGVHTPEFSSRKTSTTCDGSRPRWTSGTRSRSTTIGRSGVASPITTGRRCTFVDAEGRVRDRHFGEGKYEQSETTIRRMLGDAGNRSIVRA